MKLYVDDLRKCPEGWQLARTVTEAIRILATGMVEKISLDHDIVSDGSGFYIHMDESYEPIAYYIALMPKKPIVRFHTANYDAGRNMARIIGCPFDHVDGVK